MENDLWLLFLVLGLLVLGQLASIARSLDRTAAMMKRLLSQEGIAWEAYAEPSAEVQELARDATTRIAAIKAYREQTGLGLRDAKAVVDRLSRTHRSAAEACVPPDRAAARFGR